MNEWMDEWMWPGLSLLICTKGSVSVRLGWQHFVFCVWVGTAVWRGPHSHRLAHSRALVSVPLLSSLCLPIPRLLCVLKVACMGCEQGWGKCSVFPGTSVTVEIDFLCCQRCVDSRMQTLGLLYATLDHTLGLSRKRMRISGETSKQNKECIWLVWTSRYSQIPHWLLLMFSYIFFQFTFQIVENNI